MVKVWGEKAGNKEFTLGSYIKFTNVIVEHYQDKVSLSMTEETNTEVSFISSFNAARDPAYSQPQRSDLFNWSNAPAEAKQEI